MFIYLYIKKLLDRVLVLNCSVLKDLPGCRPAPEGDMGVYGIAVLSFFFSCGISVILI